MGREKTVARNFFDEEVFIADIRNFNRKDIRDLGITDNDQIGHILNGSKNPKYSPNDEEYAQAERKPPEELVCSISGDVFKDPVFATDGKTYERQEIERWINLKSKAVESAKRLLRASNNQNEQAKAVVEAGIKSPLGICKLRTTLTDNRDMKRRAAQWREANM